MRNTGRRSLVSPWDLLVVCFEGEFLLLLQKYDENCMAYCHKDGLKRFSMDRDPVQKQLP